MSALLVAAIALLLACRHALRPEAGVLRGPAEARARQRHMLATAAWAAAGLAAYALAALLGAPVAGAPVVAPCAVMAAAAFARLALHRCATRRAEGPCRAPGASAPPRGGA